MMTAIFAARENSGQVGTDPRVRILLHGTNGGVCAATLTGHARGAEERESSFT